MKYIMLSLVWTAYFALHSGMISLTVTAYLRRALGNGFRFYRLFYNIFSIVTLVPVLRYSGMVKDPVFFGWDGYYAVLKWALLGAGIFLFVAGSMNYSFLRFFGIQEILDGAAQGAAGTGGRLKTRGILKFIRHPFYSGIILIFWSGDLDWTRLIINAIVTAYVIIGTYLEERKLIVEFGDAYIEYRTRAPMFVPWRIFFDKESNIFAPLLFRRG